MFSSYYLQSNGHVYPNKVNQDDRRVAVIDFEDRDQVERLWDAMEPQWRTEGWQWVQAALREFADPKPPPSCPASLTIGGAVLHCDRDPGHVTDHRNDSIGQGVRWSA